jgi:hypothetical protein
MLRWGVSILVGGVVLAWILNASGGVGSCGPKPGMVPIMIGAFLALPAGALLTMIGLLRLAFLQIRNRDRGAGVGRITPP